MIKKLEIPLLLIILFPVAFFGFDFTDLGYHITNHIQANNLGLDHLLFNPIWGGSDIVGGLWIKLFGEDLWVMRLFPTLIYCLCFIVLSLCTQSEYLFPLLILTLFSASPMPSGMIYLADYYTLPMLGVCCWSLLWFKFNNEKNSSRLTLTLLALSAFITAALRLPMIALVAIPFSFFILEWNKKKMLSWVILVLSGVAIFYFSGFIEKIIHGFKQQSFFLAKFSDFDSFVHTFIRHTYENLLFLGKILAFTYLIHKVTKKSFLSCTLSIFAILFSLEILDSQSMLDGLGILKKIADSSGKRALTSFHLLLMLSSLIGIWRDRTKLYLLPIVFMPVLLNFGTSTGISKFNYLLACSFFCLIQIQRISISKKILYIFLAISIPWNYKNFYRDGALNEMVNLDLKVPKLSHLKTSKNTKNKIFWINKKLNDENLKGLTIFTFPALPSINYINESPLYLGYPWPHFIKEDLLKNELSKDCQSGKLKAAFIAYDFPDSPKLIDHILGSCPVKNQIKFENIQYISF